MNENNGFKPLIQQSKAKNNYNKFEILLYINSKLFYKKFDVHVLNIIFV